MDDDADYLLELIHASIDEWQRRNPDVTSGEVDAFVDHIVNEWDFAQAVESYQGDITSAVISLLDEAQEATGGRPSSTNQRSSDPAASRSPLDDDTIAGVTAGDATPVPGEVRLLTAAQNSSMPELEDLAAMTGLAEVKQQVLELVAMTRTRQLRSAVGLANLPSSNHLVFVGRPGTGKTTVARLLARIYASLGVVSSGHLVEVSRADLVGGYLGQTAIKTTEAFDEAAGGVLFIDEAYALSRGPEFAFQDAFGLEAVDTIVKLMEDRRDDLVVIAAGYPEPMNDFINSNPGLKSRFSRTIYFHDYTDIELWSIFESMASDHGYLLGPGVAATALTRVSEIPRDENFANARSVRNIFEGAIALHALRMAEQPDPSKADLQFLIESDLAIRPD